MSIILNDNFEPTLWPLFRLKPAFAFADGIFSALDRVLFSGDVEQKKITILTGGLRENSEEFYEDFFKHKGIDISFNIEKQEKEILRPVSFINSFAEKMQSDIRLLKREDYNKDLAAIGVVQGDKNDLWAKKDVEISSMAFIDVREGPVIIESGAKISAFSHIEGPAYVGKMSRLDRAYVKKSRVAFNCRIGGEVENSFFSDFSNKHHEGFVGHSLVGEWVNLGALTTTSDLKNNYGEVRFSYKDEVFSAQTIKFGSIIGDFVKTAIGTTLNTGTIIDIGSLLYEGRAIMKYYPPFFWGGSPQKYLWEKFLADTAVIMKRREKKPDDFIEKYLKKSYDYDFKI
ncbi:MAG: glucose-1-phosphate thymidylyltransferase [Spirochaetia bacterium]|nr:glucose-1-phosphate thymidylyltransferase [Spirochaetia bacterium]